MRHAKRKQLLNSATSGEIAALAPSAVPPVAPPKDDRRTAQWKGCCKLAVNLHRKPVEFLQFRTKLESGHRVPQVDDQRMVTAALQLVNGLAVVGVRRWDFLPAPSEGELAQLEDWAAQRLADRRTEQDREDEERRLLQKQARAFGERPAGNGTINPVHRQRSKYSLDQLMQRLHDTIAKHKAAGREFTHALLDHQSDHYIRVQDGGISNKQVIIASCEISGRQERRPFDEHFEVVWTRYREWKARQQSEGRSHD